MTSLDLNPSLARRDRHENWYRYCITGMLITQRDWTDTERDRRIWQHRSEQIAKSMIENGIVSDDFLPPDFPKFEKPNLAGRAVNFIMMGQYGPPMKSSSWRTIAEFIRKKVTFDDARSKA